MALGAGDRQVRILVVRQALLPIALGASVGLAMSLALGTVIPGFLSEVAAFEPLPLTGVTVTLSVVALLASYLPARRASRIDPVEALRSD